MLDCNKNCQRYSSLAVLAFLVSLFTFVPTRVFFILPAALLLIFASTISLQTNPALKGRGLLNLASFVCIASVFFSFLANRHQFSLQKQIVSAVKYTVAGLKRERHRSDYYRSDGYDKPANGLRRFHYPGGKIKCEGVYSSGKKNGYFRWYYQNGQVKTEGTYIDDKQEGEFKWFSSDGALWCSGNYKGGSETGDFKWFYDDGALKEECGFRAGIKEGPCRYYYHNGKVKSEMYYVNGQTQGSVRWYFSDGLLEREGEYKQGVPDGIFKDYNRNGTLLREQVYIKGVLVDKAK